MSLLIDGYNLLNVTGIFGSNPGGPRSFERARYALLDFLADRLTPAECVTTTVVFDAQEAPPGLPHTLVHRGIVVRYAPRSEEADDLIEALILEQTSPRQLTVVSSDHRLQRAARRRRARAVDSDVWFREFTRTRPAAATADLDSKPATPLSEGEVNAWVEQFRREGKPADGRPR